MNWGATAKWANDNEGVLALVAIVLTVPSLAILVWQGFRRVRPTSSERQRMAVEEFAHAERLKKDVEDRTKWNTEVGFFGEFMIRDVERKLPRSEERHSSVDTPYSIAVLTDIHSDHLEFTNGSFGIRHIKLVGDSWYFAEQTEEGARRVNAVFWMNYRASENGVRPFDVRGENVVAKCA